MDLRVERGKTTRERLLEVGHDLFGTHGYESTSVGAILDAAGLARGAFYHHFATKAELFDAVLDRVFAQLAEASADAARVHKDPVARLRAGCASWLDNVMDPAVQRITIVDAPSVVGWARCRELDSQYTLGRTKSTLRRVARDSQLPEDNIDVLAHMLLAAVSEAAVLIATADDPTTARADGQAALDILLDRLLRAS